MGNLNFQTDSVAPSNLDFEPLPNGRYRAMISASEVKATSDGTGMRLVLEMSILESGFEGRKVFGGLNIRNKSSKAQDIGLGMLSSLCQALGKVGIVDDSSELHDKPFILGVKVKPASGEYAAGNEVTGFWAITGGARTPTAGAAPKATNKAPTTPAAEQTSFADDDIPF